ncbi:thioesterase [Xanthomonas sp. A2111]|uniref:Alpha/beta fold hydrolase n=1 Tax=Xanthomonas hawaiiensis TaxID=3003247 RepID=A0ABU2HZ30_9XANT|nr:MULTISPECIES: alpha/beta fold hydrolase [unclassified Xanthomonas]MBO9830333.1 thioesterase [Xanthomonas sp. A2111]MBO9872137.1 thioesterase [Xanthomonas sp. D-93]MDS9991144.1 alpha/beta fold hydrolase [Xanthomonas sp. A2111]WNH46809.1 alpha/beta fold hydrolase [Xanthomonas sp. A6251]
MRDSQSRPRLICLPYAGGSQHIFQAWATALTAHIDVICPVFPGRGSRLYEPAIPSIDGLVAWLRSELSVQLQGDFSIWGHSMGGLLGYELSRSLVASRLAAPRHLFVSGRLPPHCPRRRDQYHLADDQLLIERLRQLGGTPPEVLANNELMALLLPILRADIAACEDYVWMPDRVPLMVPITIMGGDADPEVSLVDLQGWHRCTGGKVRILSMQGGHFFLHENVEAIAKLMHRTLTS